MYHKTVLLLVFLPFVLAETSEEARFHHNRRRRPCISRTPEGRTFLDWNFQYLDVNYNYNYNIDCGGSNQKPGHKPGKPGRPGLFQGDRPMLGLFGNGGFIPGILSQTQSLTQDIFNSFGSLLPQNLGQGISSAAQNFGQGFNTFLQNRPVSSPSPAPLDVATATIKPDPVDPDDVIYNDEKPVTEIYDDVLPDMHNKPGQYLVASNPVLGDFVQDLNFGFSNKDIRLFNRKFNRLVVRPLAHLLK